MHPWHEPGKVHVLDELARNDPLVYCHTPRVCWNTWVQSSCTLIINWPCFIYYRSFSNFSPQWSLFLWKDVLTLIWSCIFQWWFVATGATYSVEQPEQRTGSQTAAWWRHVGQFEPAVPPGIVGLHGGQGMLLISEQRRGNSEWVDALFKKKRKKYTAEKDQREKRPVI